MTDMSIFMHFIYSFIATIGFAVFLNAPRFTLIPNGFVGGIGWSIYFFFITLTDNEMVANFMAALLVSLMSEILARKLKQPATVFVIPGIILLVPGLGMYKTMLYLVQNDYANAISKGADVLFIGGAISMGVLIITALFRMLSIVSQRKATSK
ncbi:threonine/serine exporter family protein [Terrisporobacter mayombei]|nr:threonine/serine exporter family protein [Terrisporobacter mayombei]